MQTGKKNGETAERKGLVVSYFGNSVAVEAEDGDVFQCHLKRNQLLPVVGDRVVWQLVQGDQGTINRIEERSSLLARGEHGQMKPIAANINYIIIVMSPPPIFSDYLVDRYLVAAELLQIPALLVMNKSDLLTNTTLHEAQEHLVPYQKLYPTLITSIYQSESLEALSQFIANKAAVLVGPSGVGKSSIIAGLGSEDPIRIGDVSEKGAGKHTTTATRLYHLPDGGRLIDSPGVREFSLWSVTKPEVLKGFKEFNHYAKQCKFRDCQHLVEPDCGIKAAVANNEISSQRYTSYQTLMDKALSPRHCERREAITRLPRRPKGSSQ